MKRILFMLGGLALWSSGFSQEVDFEADYIDTDAVDSLSVDSLDAVSPDALDSTVVYLESMEADLNDLLTNW